MDAHRLVRWAARFGRADEVVEAVLAAHFTDGRDIGDANVLAAIAASCGLRPAAARSFLASDAEIDSVHGDNLRAHRLGINGVPCFVVAGNPCDLGGAGAGGDRVFARCGGG